MANLSTPASHPARCRLQTLTGFHSRFLGNSRDVRVAIWDEKGVDGRAEHAATNSRPGQPQLWRRWIGRHRSKARSLLLLNDGQDLEQVGVIGTLDALIQAGEIPAPIVVAVPSNSERMMEYGISGHPDFAGRGARAQAYAKFVVTELLPAVRAQFGVSTRPATTAVLGASLGGLSAFDLAWRHPDVFGICGVFSGSFWWRSDSSDARSKQSSRIAHRLVRECPDGAVRARWGVRFWFQAGTADETEDRDGNGVIDAIQDTTELGDELVARGWQPGRQFAYHEIPNGRHEPSTWATAFGEFARFAFGD